MTQAFDDAVRVAAEAIEDCEWDAKYLARAILHAVLPAEPTPEAIEAMKIAYIAAIVQPDRWERTYRALRAHLLGEDA